MELYIFIWIICGLVCVKIAKDKNLNPYLAFFLGTALGVLAILGYIFLAEKKEIY